MNSGPSTYTTSSITLQNRWDHFLARMGYNRNGHQVAPGLYMLGNPGRNSPVVVTANYTLSFDALRSALEGIDCYILVLNTEGINVWCAAGKGTFGTDELVHKIETTNLCTVVNHRVLVLPQLGAPGVSAHKVKKRSTFTVEYGPVRASDLPAYLTHKATPQMRQVQFTFWDRFTLIPVELTHVFLPLLTAAVILFYAGGVLASAAVVTAILAGVVVFPLLLPWIPTHDFSTKGFILGGLVALPFAVLTFYNNQNAVWWQLFGKVATHLLVLPPVTAFVALNFTGSTTFTSRSGVRREIFTYIPVMAVLFAAGIIIMISLPLIQLLRGYYVQLI